MKSNAKTEESEEKAVPQPARKRQSKADELLDEALENTFPASDPVSASQPVADKRRN